MYRKISELMTLKVTDAVEIRPVLYTKCEVLGDS